MSNAPIIVFAYKRLDHLRRAIESLRANPEATQSALVIACDGPKRDEDKTLCAAVQEYAHAVGDGFQSVEVRVSPRNRGLAASLTSGVTAMLQQHERVIVVEDDLELSPHFLRYMNDGLDCYADDALVASIHGYCYPVSGQLPETFFLRGADCWGWATWRRAWQHFRADGAYLRDELVRQRMARPFDLDGAYPFFRMLQDQIAGKNDSWAIRWHASCFLDGMLTLYPGRSLVHNGGFDESGTHCAPTAIYDTQLSQQPVKIVRLPLEESAVGRDAFIKYLRPLHAPSLVRRALGALRRRARLLISKTAQGHPK